MAPQQTQLLLAALQQVPRIAHMHRDASASKHRIQELISMTATRKSDNARKTAMHARQCTHVERTLEIKAQLATSLLEAMVNRKSETIRSAFSEIASAYAAQQQAYFEQRARLTEAIISCVDALQRATLETERSAIDKATSSIRADYRQLFAAMTNTVERLGMAMPQLQLNDHEQQLLGTK